MSLFDVVILTDSRYVAPSKPDIYTQNILDEDELVKKALERKGLRVGRTNWDNPQFDWSQTDHILFRTTWDYFDRFPEFDKWLQQVSTQTQLINPAELIRWNIDKHYLIDLQQAGIHIPPTYFIEPGDELGLAKHFLATSWSDVILKPAISGAARHTYRINTSNIAAHETIFKELIAQESMLLQEFQQQVVSKGEISLMVFGGKFSHAVLKKAKLGDFRVQDDFGGSVHTYQANTEEIAFAEKVVTACSSLPAYARVDVIWDNQDNLAVSELELIEPELWFRLHPPAADFLAAAIAR